MHHNKKMTLGSIAYDDKFNNNMMSDQSVLTLLV